MILMERTAEKGQLCKMCSTICPGLSMKFSALGLMFLEGLLGGLGPNQK